jgi:CheY-like chemotaxis protein
LSKLSKTILVVDDDDAVRLFVESALDSEGYDVLTARNGKEALRLLNDRAVDLVVTDLMMPEMDGQELSQHLRRITPLPILMMSGNREAGSTPELVADVDAFIPKPVGLVDLLLTVQRLLTSHRHRVRS